MSVISRAYLLTAIMLFGAASADDITLNWTNPDQNEQCVDGGVYDNPGGTSIWQLIVDIPDPDQSITSYVIPDMKPGVYTYIATAYNDQQNRSRVSGSATKTVDIFSVIDERAYIVAKINGGFLLLVVGTVPLGTACNPTTEVNGMNAVPASQVTFTGAQDVVVVAKCG